MAKKSLGQNFLKSKKTIEKIVDISNVTNQDVVLEVGPGKGALTEFLLEKSKQVIAYEKDKDLIPFLLEKFKEYKNLTLVEGDILEITSEDIKKITKQYKVVANIPYYITGAIIELFLSISFQPTLMTLLIQKEVAERIMARDGKESILSISVKAYGNPKIVAKVPKHYFSPAPKVDSAVISITNISKDFFKNFSEEEFFFVVKKAFQFKRKNIFNNLKGNFINAEDILSEISVNKTDRAEDLSLETFALLTQKLVKKM